MTKTVHSYLTVIAAEDAISTAVGRGS